jgi:hypothetical protein
LGWQSYGRAKKMPLRGLVFFAALTANLEKYQKRQPNVNAANSKV